MASLQSGMAEAGVTRGRIELIDLARGLALVAMAIYHFAWDLEFFGYAAPGMTADGGWRLFARAIASSFLFLAGVSLVLAHGRAIRWEGFWRRFAMVAGAALAISVATYVALPSGFIFFGILHQIAFASLAGLLFVGLPWPVTLVASALVIALPSLLRVDAFDHWLLWWTGLSPAVPRSNDFVPVFPWFGAVLAGIAAGRLAVDAGLVARMRAVVPGRWSVPFQTAGRHSLAVYLVHQPVLLGCLFLASQVWPAAQETPAAAFMRACELQCADLRDAEFCTRYCICFLDVAEDTERLDELVDGSQTAEMSAWIDATARQCTGEAEQMR